MNSNIYWICFFLLCSNIIRSQSVQLFPTKVREHRTLDPKKSFIEIDFTTIGLRVNKNKQIKLGEKVLAVDSQGKELEMQKSSFGNGYDERGNVSIKLDVPSREAQSIESIKGVLKYYQPTETNGGKVIVKNYLERVNTNLLKGVDDKIVLLLIDKSTLEEKLKENDKEIDQQIDRVKDSLLVNSKELELLRQVIQSFGSTIGSGSKKQLNFYAEGESKRIISVNVYDKEGKKMNYSSMRMNRAWNLRLSEEMQRGWTIEILIENEAALKEIEFIVKNILLP